MLELSSLAIDVEKSEQGEWFPFVGTDASFKIRRFNNDKAEALQAQLTLDNWDVLTGEDKELAAKTDYELRAKVLAQEILVDWKGIGENGVETKFTPELAFKYLSDRRFMDLRRFIERVAMNTGNWRAKVEEEAADSVKDTAAT